MFIQRKLAVLLVATAICALHARAEIGQWDFNSGDLSPTAGATLGALDYASGIGGATQLGTTFGTTTSFGIPNINGTPAAVMHFPACVDLSMGYVMPTPTVANGTNFPVNVNSWSLIMDLLYTGSAANSWRSLIETDLSGDGDLFINTAGGIGIGGQYSGKILSNTWHRVGFVLDLTNGVMNKFIDGTLVGSQPYTSQDGRWSLMTSTYAFLFSDNDGEAAPGYVNSVQLRDTALSLGQMAALGGPSAAGIPINITVVPATITSRSPAPGSGNASPLPTLTVVINDGTTTITGSSVKLSLDGIDLPTSVNVVGDLNTATATATTILGRLTTHTAAIRFTDNVNGSQTNSWTFTVAGYQDITLPAPIYLETFDELAEGTLPTGWSATNNTTQINPILDLADFTSDSYLNWVVISSNRLATGGANYVTSVPILVNGASYPLISNNVIHANSDLRSGDQVQVLFTSDYNLTGKTNVHLVFNSIFRQNGDSMGSVEYSIDHGANWLPLLYLIENSDVLRNADYSVDAVTTLTTPRADQAWGLAYGDFIGAPVTAALGAYIRGMATDDLSGKRVEMFRCPAADGQPAVRFRFAQAGTGSWYFGIDNFGLYSLNTPPTILGVSPTSRNDWVGMTGTGNYFAVTAGGPEPYAYQWYRNGAQLPGKTLPVLRLDNGSAANAGSYTVVVSNANGSATSSPVTVTMLPPDAAVAGQWNFDRGDLSADRGQPLAYASAQVQADTSFGTTTSFGISDIAGVPAKVMRWLPTTDSGGYVMTHGIAPNGGGTRVNQYTVIIDLYYPSSSAGWLSLWQTGSPGNADGEAFINSSGAIGTMQVYSGALTFDQWHRVVLSYDLTQREFGKYIDGVNAVAGQTGVAPYGPHEAQYLPNATTTAEGGGVDLRWSLAATAQLMGDNDGEVGEVYVSSVQIRNGRMSDAAIAALGAPTAAKIPGLIRAAKAGGNIVVDWTGTALRSAPAVTGPWSVITDAGHPYVIPAGAANVFFKAAQQ